MTADPSFRPQRQRMSPYQTAVPDRIARLPVDAAGQPIPWFAGIVDGKPDLRLASESKLRRAVADGRCWICGEPFARAGERTRSFIVGPLAAFNRRAVEPPSHRTCALYALRVCPFLTHPARDRRTANLPDDELLHMPGNPVLDNPGISFVWQCRRYDIEQLDDGGMLFALPWPSGLIVYSGGLPALRDQLNDGLDRAETRIRAALADDGADPAEIDTVVRTGRALVASRLGK